MLVQAGLCRTCSETTLLVFPRGGSNTVSGGSASDSSSSDDDDMFEGPFPEPRIPTEIEPDEQFQQDLVKAFIGKTKCWAKESDNSSDSSDDDSFISKKSKKHRKKRPVKTVTVEKNGIKSEKNSVVKDGDKDDDKMVIERMENKTDERPDENADMVSQRLEFQTDKNVENEKAVLALTFWARKS